MGSICESLFAAMISFWEVSVLIRAVTNLVYEEAEVNVRDRARRGRGNCGKEI
jgi:hypothetical protein